MDIKEACELQRLLNTGAGWRFEGSFGRALMDHLGAGNLMLGKEPCRDYWGNFVPSRSMVKPGTKGSRELVEETHGAEYAQTLSEV